MEKTLRVKNCYECPFCTGKDKTFFWCKRLKTNGSDPHKIPDWCPLEDSRIDKFYLMMNNEAIPRAEAETREDLLSLLRQRIKAKALKDEELIEAINSPYGKNMYEQVTKGDRAVAAAQLQAVLDLFDSLNVKGIK